MDPPSLLLGWHECCQLAPKRSARISGTLGFQPPSPRVESWRAPGVSKRKSKQCLGGGIWEKGGRLVSKSAQNIHLQQNSSPKDPTQECWLSGGGKGVFFWGLTAVSPAQSTMPGTQ